jgi:hypothetical protein
MTKPNKTAKEEYFELWEMEDDLTHLDDDIWNWHISQIKKLENEIKSELHIQAKGFKGWWINVSDVLKIIKKYEK